MLIIILSLSVALLWGLNAVVTKIIFDNGIDTKTCFVVSSVLYFLLSIVIYFAYFDFDSIKSINKKGWFLLIIYTLLSVIAYIVYLYCIEETTDINTIVAITCISPIFTLILSKMFNKSTINLIQMIGVILTTIGVSLVVYCST